MSKEFDRFIRLKTRWIAFVAALGFLLLPFVFYFGWPRAEAYNPSLALACRWISVTLSVVLAWMVYDRERAVLAVRHFRLQQLWKLRRAKKKGKPMALSPSEHEHQVLLATANTLGSNLKSHLHFSGIRTVVSHSPYILLLMFLCLLCPFPALENWSAHFANDKIGLLMVVRIPIVGLWLLHDESKLFRERHTLCLKERTYLSLDHMLALRSLNRSHPGIFIATFCASTALTLSCALWVLERDDSRNGLDTYSTCLAVTLMNVMFKWPDDSWFTHTPQTSLGRVCAALSSLCGVLILFMLLEVCYDALTLSTAEQYLFNYVGLKQAKREERTAAARVIQFHWRYQRSIALIMERERADTLKARVLDRTQHARRVSQFQNLSFLATQQGELEDEYLETGRREPLLKMEASVDAAGMGSREREVAMRYGQYWEEDAASYKVQCDTLRKELRRTHRNRLELEGFSCKKVSQEPSINTVIRRAMVTTTQDVVCGHVEESLSRLLKAHPLEEPSSLNGT